MSFTCDHCNQSITDGNVMVDNHAYTHEDRIPDLKVICKPCTRAMDEQAGGRNRNLHSIWQLPWLQENTLRLLATVLAGLLDGEGKHKKWERPAVQRFYDLAAAAHPNLMADPLGMND